VACARAETGKRDASGRYAADERNTTSVARSLLAIFPYSTLYVAQQKAHLKLYKLYQGTQEQPDEATLNPPHSVTRYLCKVSPVGWLALGLKTTNYMDNITIYIITCRWYMYASNLVVDESLRPQLLQRIGL
jgi:hypothetical protein